jgi:hypothetical protein
MSYKGHACTGINRQNLRRECLRAVRLWPGCERWKVLPCLPQAVAAPPRKPMRGERGVAIVTAPIANSSGKRPGDQRNRGDNAIARPPVPHPGNSKQRTCRRGGALF